MAMWPVRGISARAGDWCGLPFATRSSARDIGLHGLRAVAEPKPPGVTLLSVMALGAVLADAPWAWRNYTTFDAVFFIRSNLGLELRMGNQKGRCCHGSDGCPTGAYPSPHAMWSCWGAWRTILDPVHPRGRCGLALDRTKVMV